MGYYQEKIKLEEHSHETLVREVKKEIGIEIAQQDLSLLFVKEVPNLLNIIHMAFFIYVGVLDENISIILNDKLEESFWFGLDNLPKDKSDDNI